jgi:hypothetical protein
MQVKTNNNTEIWIIAANNWQLKRMKQICHLSNKTKYGMRKNLRRMYMLYTYYRCINKLPGIESREYGSRDPSRWPRDNIYPRKLALTLPTSGGRSVSIVLSRTQVTESFK